MENVLTIIGVLHFAASVWAGMVGDKRTCGFFGGMLSYALCPALGVLVVLAAKEK